MQKECLAEETARGRKELSKFQEELEGQCGWNVVNQGERRIQAQPRSRLWKSLSTMESNLDLRLTVMGDYCGGRVKQGWHNIIFLFLKASLAAFIHPNIC